MLGYVDLTCATITIRILSYQAIVVYHVLVIHIIIYTIVLGYLLYLIRILLLYQVIISCYIMLYHTILRAGHCPVSRFWRVAICFRFLYWSLLVIFGLSLLLSFLRILVDLAKVIALSLSLYTYTYIYIYIYIIHINVYIYI